MSVPAQANPLDAHKNAANTFLRLPAQTWVDASASGYGTVVTNNQITCASPIAGSQVYTSAQLGVQG